MKTSHFTRPSVVFHGSRSRWVEAEARCFNHLFPRNLQLLSYPQIPRFPTPSFISKSKFHPTLNLNPSKICKVLWTNCSNEKKHMFYHFEQAELKLSQKKSETTTPTPLKPTSTTTTRPPQQPILSVAPSFLKLKSTTAIIRKKAERMTQILGLRMFL